MGAQFSIPASWTHTILYLPKRAGFVSGDLPRGLPWVFGVRHQQQLLSDGTYEYQFEQNATGLTRSDSFRGESVHHHSVGAGDFSQGDGFSTAGKLDQLHQQHLQFQERLQKEASSGSDGAAVETTEAAAASASSATVDDNEVSLLHSEVILV